MMLIEDTPIADASLPVAAFRAHLRLGTGFGLEDAQDAVLTSFLRAAMAAVEARTGKVLLARDFMLTVSRWQDEACHGFPVAPVLSVGQLDLVGADGSREIADLGRIWLEADMHRPKLRATGTRLPRIAIGGRAEITFEAGIAQGWEGLPNDLQQAVLMLAAHYYEYRNDTGLSDGCMPFGVTSLLERHRNLRLGAAQ